MPHSADDDIGDVLARAYNRHLARAKQRYPGHHMIAAMAALGSVESSTKLGDLLVRAGQIMASIQEEETAGGSYAS